MTAGNGPQRGRPRDPQIDAQVLTTTLELIVEGGLAHATMERVASRAGVSKVTVYRRWSSKEALIAAALESGRDAIATPDWADDESRPVGELINDLVGSWAERLVEPGFAALVAQMIAARNDHPDLTRVWWDIYAEPRRRSARIVMERAQRDGTMRADVDLEIAMDMMAGAITYQLLLHPGNLTAVEAEAYLRSVFTAAGFTLDGPTDPKSTRKRRKK